ncbi:hypothetical protein CUMW_207410 [Citrus unshiu]|uniref:non-specific serine/threonine protein kinase n=1 Tax=Citrus unshiu TaxID=55188 RepID=A0A2H5QA60_CITUN|nr:hypothetical protein CUMW_207410 [Citrus unshiu]
MVSKYCTRRGKFRYLASIFKYASTGYVVVSEIPLGSKLSVVENDLWLSSNGDFALGFFNRSDQPNQFGIGIRFNSRSIPVDKQPVVWVAGADAAVGNSSRSFFQLTQNGELLLFDGSGGVPVWTTKTSQLSVASAVLRDDGNFVLLNDKKEIVWQSFDTPTDTLLPGQKLSVSEGLRATSRNPVSSYYTLYMSDLGQLELRWESSINYWKSGGPSHLNLSAVLTSNGTLQFLDQNLEPVWSVSGADHHESVKFRFLRLDLDGNLRLYSWVEVSRSWRSVWQAVENQCNVFATCGERGICVFNSSGSPDCKCPFKYNSASNLKCLLPNQCKSSSTWVELEHTLLYGMYPANDSISQSSLQRCKDMCLHDSLCMAVTFTNNRLQRMPNDNNPDNVSGYPRPLLISSGFFLSRSEPPPSISDPLAADFTFPMNSAPIPPSWQSLSACIPCLHRGSVQALFVSFIEFSENFKYPIGPKMFKGMLPHIDNQPVAIKELDTTTEQRKFRGAVSKIGNIHHKNLTKLEEFVSHGNLKCENVLLDENFEAKVTDFGLGIFHGDASIYGTSAGKDVEDFGKMVLILVNGSREVEDVCEWAYNEWMEGAARDNNR